MIKGINFEKVTEKIPEYENNETAPTFCNNYWSRDKTEEMMKRRADQVIQMNQSKTSDFMFKIKN